METKKCTNCLIEKDILHFHKLKNGYYKSNCKECRSKSAKEYKDSKKDGTYYLYYIPEEHYVGITNYLSARMSKHKHYNKLTEGFEIICAFKSQKQAHLYETLLHCMGYNGFRP